MGSARFRLHAPEIAVLLAFICTILFQSFSFAKGCDNLYDNMLRLHVIANSDSPSDQQLKLLVRDTVLSVGKAYFDGSVNVQNAKDKLLPHFSDLESAAESVLRENGCDRDVHITLERTYFDTRTYGEWTVPAGMYEAVCVRIGKAEGHNWWCVMFPPLCLPAAGSCTDAVFSADGKRVLSGNPKVDVRFKIVELVQQARAKRQK